MKILRLVVSLMFFVPAMALLGAFASLDGQTALWPGLLVGGLVGVFFGLVFGGARGRWLDYVYGPEEPEEGAGIADTKVR